MRPGERINEVHLAEELSISRSPLREALSALVSEGFLTNQPRRGFFVRDLADQEIEHIYAIRALLDPAALAAAGIPDQDRLGRLAALNQQILATSGDPLRTIELDDDWHLELLAACTNDTLLDLIRQLMAQTRPYEYAYMREHANLDTVVREHQQIILALAAEDMSGACEALRQNMQSAVGPLLAWRARHQEQRADALLEMR